MRQYLGIPSATDIINGNALPPQDLGRAPVVNALGSATATLSAAQSNSVVFFDRAAGIVYTLPPAATSPIGTTFTFITTVAITSNSAKVITDNAAVFLVGGLSMINATACATFVANGTTIVSVLSNGTTTGGLTGGSFSLTLISPTQWAVSGALASSGTVATPFSTT